MALRAARATRDIGGRAGLLLVLDDRVEALLTGWSVMNAAGGGLAGGRGASVVGRAGGVVAVGSGVTGSRFLVQVGGSNRADTAS